MCTRSFRVTNHNSSFFDFWRSTKHPVIVFFSLQRMDITSKYRRIAIVGSKILVQALSTHKHKHIFIFFARRCYNRDRNFCEAIVTKAPNENGNEHISIWH